MGLWIICIELQLILIFFGSSQDYLPEFRHKFTVTKNYTSNFSEVVQY